MVISMASLRIVSSRILPSALAAATIVIAPDARAEIYDCNGVWKTARCSGEPSRVLPEVSSRATDPDRSDRESLLHELTMRSIRAREEFDIRVDLSDAENVCKGEGASLERCRETVRRIEADLEQRTLSHSAVAGQREANRLQDEANRLSEERNADGEPTVVVVERPTYIIPRRRWRHHGGHGHHHHGHGTVQSGTSLSVGATSADGTVSVGVTTGESIITDGPRPVYIDPVQSPFADSRPRPRAAGGSMLSVRGGSSSHRSQLQRSRRSIESEAASLRRR